MVPVKTICAFILTLNACWTLAVDEMANPMTPVKPLKLTLEEDLRITPEDRDDHYLWVGNNVSVSVDDRGHFFVVDPRGNRIVELDPKGEFVREIGGPGEGPGEFRALNAFQILADGTGRAFDTVGPVSYLTIYDDQMELVEKKRLETGRRIYRRISISPEEAWIAATVTQVDTDRNVEITEFLLADKKFEAKEVLLNWESPGLDPQKVSEASYWVDFLSHRFDGMSKGQDAYAAFDDKGQVYTAGASKYEITRRNADLTPNLKITKKYKPIPQTEEEVDALVSPIRDALLSQLPQSLLQIVTENVIQRAIKKAEFPPVKFPVSGLVTMGDYLVVIHGVNYQSLVGNGDIFDKQGRYRGSFQHPGNGLQRMSFKGEYAYTIETVDEESELVRYKYKLESI